LSLALLDSVTAAVPTGKQPGAEPIPGYRLIEPLGKGGFGEVWKCEAPGGLLKAIKFVSGGADTLDADNAAQQELESLEHVKGIRHPFMLSMERVDVCDGDLLIVMELADGSLHDVWTEHRAAGRPGIPRQELLGYLREAAEVLDFMNRQHGLQHLDIKPRNLFLVSQHVKVADYGLVKSLAERKKDSGPLLLAGVTPLYAAPEIFNGQIADTSDQYSLAVTYQELLTGTYPIQGKNGRQLMMNHLTAAPQLEALPECDRAIIARALSKEPEQRFATCLDLINSLTAGPTVAARLSAPPPSEMVSSAGQTTSTSASGLTPLPPGTKPPKYQGPLRGLNPWMDCPADAVPGYQLLACLSTHPLGDHWAVRAPDGRERWLQMLNTPPAEGTNLADKLKRLRHPALPPVEILGAPSGRVYLAFDPFEQTLRERFEECRANGLAGIPREELLEHLGRCAAALDDLQERYHLPHLCLQPRHILLSRGGAQLFQFGLAPLAWLAFGKAAGELNARYASPELFQPGASPSADQYSLAMIYVEMLTGVLPRQPRQPAQRGGGRAGARSERIDLQWLPAFDRPVLARALSNDPSARFSSCREFVEALDKAARRHERTENRALRPIVHAVRLEGEPKPATPLPESVEAVATRWVLAATGAQTLRQHGAIRCLHYADRTIEHRYPVRIIPGALQLKLHDFPRQCSAQVVRQDNDVFVCRIAAER
jgi:serine/threonine protein kinase